MVLQTAAGDEPRFDHSLAGGTLGLLIEEARTNICLQSEAFGTTWTTVRASITDNDEPAPDGNTTADKLVEDGTASSTHLCRQSISITTGTIYTYSVFAKMAERDHVRLVMNTATFPAFSLADFDLSTGTVLDEGVGADSSGIEDIGGGWFRCWVTATADATAANLFDMFLMVNGDVSYSGDGSSGLHLWGAQIEAGAFPTSYIKTTTGTATRAVDVATMPTANWVTPGLGTIYAAGRVWSVGNGDTQYFAVGDDGAITDAARVLATDTADAGALQTVNSGGNNGFSSAGAVVARTFFELAGTFAQDDIIAAVDGVLDATPDTLVDLPLTNPATILRLGTDSNGANYLNGHLARFKYWPFRLPNGILQELTT